MLTLPVVRRLLFFSPLTLALACNPNGDAPLTGTTTLGACPAGACDATPRLDLSTVNFVGTPFPSSLDPGEKIPVLAVMQNTGGQAWTHGPTNQRIRLVSTHVPRSFWGEPDDDMNASVPVGGTQGFELTLVGPFNTGTFPFDYRM